METSMNTDEWIKEHRSAVDAKLRRYLNAQLEVARATSADSLELVEGVDSLTMRGGKRLRPIVLAAGFASVAPERSLQDTIAAGAALELLQSYLLIHDDWMDQDEERRGGPAVHIIYEATHGKHDAAALSVLAGDLASAYAWELMLEAPFPAAQMKRGLAEFIRVHKEVFFGQHLDLTANPDVSRMHDLKTTSYTVRGPILIGALLGDATDSQLETLTAFANPIGEAFQMADDLLGTFGAMESTGKPGDDLRHGKRNSLVSDVERTVPANEREILKKVLESAAPSDADVKAATQLVIDCGAKARVEAQVKTLLAKALGTLDGGSLHPSGVRRLKDIAHKLAIRTA